MSQPATVVEEEGFAPRLKAAGRFLRMPLLALCRALAEAAWLIAIIFFAGGSVLLLRASVRPDVCRVHAPVFDAADTPEWFAGEDIEGMQKRLKSVDGRSLYDPEVASILAGALASDPWVAEVRHVRRRFPASLDCEIVIRKPYAAVEVGNRFVLVDKAGVRLPPPPLEVSPSGVPVVLGVRSYPPGPGEIWSDPAVPAALFVLSKTEDLPQATGVPGLRVTGVQVRAVKGLPAVTLRTAFGMNIDWGVVYRPGREPYGVPGVRERVQAVSRVVSAIGAGAIELIDVSVLPAAYRVRQAASQSGETVQAESGTGFAPRSLPAAGGRAGG